MRFGLTQARDGYILKQLVMEFIMLTDCTIGRKDTACYLRAEQIVKNKIIPWGSLWQWHSDSRSLCPSAVTPAKLPHFHYDRIHLTLARIPGRPLSFPLDMCRICHLYYSVNL